jgi:hypothetical protein
LPCVLCPGAQQRSHLCRAFFLGARQRASHVVSFRRRQLLFLPCAVKKLTTKIIYRVLSDAAHGKGALPCKMLPCALCRVPRRETHGKEFAVRPDEKRMAKSLSCVLEPLPWRTAKPLFPVVSSSFR